MPPENVVTTYMLIPGTCAEALIGRPNNQNPHAPVTHNWEKIEKFSATSPFVYPAKFKGTPYLAIEWEGPKKEYETFPARLLKQTLVRCASCALQQRGLCNGANLNPIDQTSKNPNLLIVQPKLVKPRNN